jgi:hypothetical protein
LLQHQAQGRSVHVIGTGEAEIAGKSSLIVHLGENRRERRRRVHQKGEREDRRMAGDDAGLFSET